MATNRKRKSGVWEYFDEPKDCEEGIVMKGLQGERYHANYAILNLLTEEA